MATSPQRAPWWPVGLVGMLLVGLGLLNISSSRGWLTQSLPAASVQAFLDQSPLQFGAWSGKVQTIPPKQLQIAEAQASLSRLYQRERPTAAVQVMLLYGPPGALGAHTPDVCFEGAGYRALGAPVRLERPDWPGHTFWHGVFETATPTAADLHCLWGWSDGEHWHASDDARLDFAAHQNIFKVYLSWMQPRRLNGSSDPVDAMKISEFFPLWQSSLPLQTLHTKGESSRQSE